MENLSKGRETLGGKTTNENEETIGWPLLKVVQC